MHGHTIPLCIHYSLHFTRSSENLESRSSENLESIRCHILTCHIDLVGRLGGREQGIFSLQNTRHAVNKHQEMWKKEGEGEVEGEVLGLFLFISRCCSSWSTWDPVLGTWCPSDYTIQYGSHLCFNHSWKIMKMFRYSWQHFGLSDRLYLRQRELQLYWFCS